MDLRRGIDPVLLAALLQTSYPVVFIYLDWPDATVRFHTSVGNLTWGGYLWKGMGELASMDIPAEQAGIAVLDATLALAGVPADLDGFADDRIRNRPAELYIGSLSDRPGGVDGNQPGTLVGMPARIFSGTMDGLSLVATAVDDGVQHEARVTVTTGQEARQNATIYHSNEDQRRLYPSDTAGRLVIMNFANAQKITWPQN